MTNPTNSNKPAAPEGLAAEKRFLRLAALGILVAIVAIYIPVYTFDFLEYDDPLYVVTNPDIQDGLTVEAVKSVFTKSYLASWHPVAMLSHALDVQLFGMNSGAHHIVSVLFHAINALLLLAAMYRLTGRPFESALVAVLFAVHPQHVEPVAWVSSRKDLLSALFMFWALYAYAGYAKRGAWWRYASVALLLTLGLLAKPMLVTLPCVLLLLDWWPLNRISDLRSAVRRAVEKVPLMAICIAVMVVTQRVQTAGGAVKNMDLFPLGARLANAVIAYAAYLQKLVWPANLSIFYPHTIHHTTSLQIALCAALVLFVSAVAASQWRKRPYLFVGWFWFAGMLVPVIGFVQFGVHGMADRYTYVSHIGLFIALVWLGREAFERWPGLQRAAAFGALAVVGGLAAVSGRYIHVFHDDIRLFRHCRDVVRPNSVVTMNLGLGLMKRSLWEEAMYVFATSLDLEPNLGNNYNNIGICYTQLGRVDLAYQTFLDGMAFAPDDPLAQRNIAKARSVFEETDKKILALAEQYNSEQANHALLDELAGLFMKVGRLEDAEESYKFLADNYPGSPIAHAKLGTFYHQDGRSELAVEEFQRALELGGSEHELLYDLGSALLAADRLEEARETLTAATQLFPPSLEAELLLERIEPAQDEDPPPSAFGPEN